MKFRVWCHDKHEWEKDDIVLDMDGILHHASPMGLRPENHVLQLCTGLKSSNGRYIYEGDIVDEGDNFDSVVKFGECHEIGTVGFYLEELKIKEGEHGRRQHPLNHSTRKTTEWKIIGNVFQTRYNPIQKEQKKPEKNRYQMIEM